MRLIPNNQSTTIFPNVVVSTNKVLDINTKDCTRLSAEISFTDSVPSTDVTTFIDGVLAHGTVTITDYTLASGTIVTVAGHALTEGVDWTAGTSNHATALSLASAIDALSEVQCAAPAAAICTVKAATIGVAGNAIATVVTGTGVTVQQALLSGGLNSAVNGTAHTITITGHGYNTALPVTYAVSAGTTITNLVNSTTYYVIVVDVNTIKLATTVAHANSGTAIAISDANDAVGGGTFTLTPIDAAVTFTYHVSNDGDVFTAITPTTVTSGGVILAFFDPIVYAFYRIKGAVTAGEADITITLHGVGSY